MERTGRFLVIGIMALTCLLVTGGGTLEGAGGVGDAGVSQFLASRGGRGHWHVINPTSHEMFALLINYQFNNEEFSNCHGSILTPKALDDMHGNIRHGYSELISVPTQKGLAGRIKDGFGLSAIAGKRTNRVVHLLNPTLYALPPDSTQKAAVISCACGELSDFSLPKNLLSRFGINCP